MIDYENFKLINSTMSDTLDLDVLDSFVNPALKQQPRYEPAPVIAVQRNTSILEWLESQGRLIERDERDPAISALDQPNLDEELFEDDRAYQEEEESDDSDDVDEI
jgi:Protein of unknown function (DUF3134)